MGNWIDCKSMQQMTKTFMTIDNLSKTEAGLEILKNGLFLPMGTDTESSNAVDAKCRTCKSFCGHVFKHGNPKLCSLLHADSSRNND